MLLATPQCRSNASADSSTGNFAQPLRDRVTKRYDDCCSLGTEHTALFQFNGKVRRASTDENDEGKAEEAAESEVQTQQLFLPLVTR